MQKNLLRDTETGQVTSKKTILSKTSDWNVVDNKANDLLELTEMVDKAVMEDVLKLWTVSSFIGLTVDGRKGLKTLKAPLYLN